MSKKGMTFENFSGALAGRLETQMGREVLRSSVSFVAGLLAARAEIVGGLSPFGVAAVAASRGSGSVFALLGAGIGYLLPGGPEYQIRYMAASITVFLFRWIFSGIESVSQHAAFAPASAGIAVGITGVAVLISDGFLFWDVVNLSAEILIAGCSALFFDRVMPLLESPPRLWGIGKHELVCVLIAFCIMLLALSRLSFAGIALGRIIGILTVLIAARFGGESGGCTAGAAAGVILGLGDENMMFILGAYAFGGMMAGVFSPSGRFGCAASFILSDAVVSICMGPVSQVITGMYEVMAAAVIFMILPERWVGRLTAIFFPAREVAGIQSAGKIAVGRLEQAASALGEVAETVSQVGGKLKKISSQDISTVYTEAADIACKHCGMRIYCWGTAYGETMDAFCGMTETLKINGILSREDVPRHFALRCCRLDDMLATINHCYAGYTANDSAQLKIDYLRGLLIDEFGGISQFLKEIGSGIEARRDVSENDLEIRTAFASSGLEIRDFTSWADKNGRLFIEAVLARKGKFALRKTDLAEKLSDVCGRTLSGPFVSGSKDHITLHFTEAPSLSCSFGRATVRKSGEKLCGDACDAFVDEEGRAFMLLSDGMGSGGSAAVDSTLTLRLMSRLLHAGFSHESALKLVNAGMLLKSGEESFATLDIAVVDLFSGMAEFLKAGAPPSYICRCGRVERISRSSLPVGILRDIRFERTKTRLHRGDLIVLVSDGALFEDDAWLVKAIENYGDAPLESFARDIVKLAKDLREDGHDDDISVNVAKIE